jgi:hypothetical protein
MATMATDGSVASWTAAEILGHSTIRHFDCGEGGTKVTTGRNAMSNNDNNHQQRTLIL